MKQIKPPFFFFLLFWIAIGGPFPSSSEAKIKWPFSNEKKFEKVTLAAVTPWNILELSDGREVRLAGVSIPTRENPNHRFYLWQNLEELLLGKELQMEIIPEPENDKRSLVYLYLNGENLNEKLLREGMAFYSRDFFEGYRIMELLEKEAKEKNRGLWKNPENLKPLFKTRKSWRFYHYASCAQVKDLNGKDTENFYLEPPPVPGGRLLSPDCPYCQGLKRKRIFRVPYGNEGHLPGGIE